MALAPDWCGIMVAESTPEALPERQPSSGSALQASAEQGHRARRWALAHTCPQNSAPPNHPQGLTMLRRWQEPGGQPTVAGTRCPTYRPPLTGPRSPPH